MQARRFLNNFFSCHSKIDILRTVINSEEPQSGRQIASKAGLSPRSCQLSLDELVRLNALNRREAGKAYYYTVNLDNQIVTNLIIPIIQQEERLTGQVVDELRSRLSWSSNSSHGVYFLESWPRSWGAKGKGTLLLSVIKDAKSSKKLEKQLKELRTYLLQNFGLPMEYKFLSREEFAELAKKKPGDLSRISYRIRDVAGEQFNELVKREKGSPEHLQRAVDFFPKKSRRRKR